MEDGQADQTCDEKNTNFMWPMAEERLIDEDKQPFVLFSSVSAEPLRRIHQSGKYSVIYTISF